MKLGLQTGHCGRTGNRYAVDEHGRVVIPLREHLRDVLEMAAYLIAALNVS